MKPERDIGAELLQSVREMKAGRVARAHHVDVSPIVEVRMKNGLSQSAFAEMIGISKRTLQEWEQGRRQPSKAAKILLKVADEHPKIFKKLAA